MTTESQISLIRVKVMVRVTINKKFEIASPNPIKYRMGTEYQMPLLGVRDSVAESCEGRDQIKLNRQATS